MAISFTNLGTSAPPDFSRSADGQSYDTDSWAPPTADLIFVFVENSRASAAGAVTVTGNSLTWTSIATVLHSSGALRLTLFGADASGSTTGVTNIAIAGTTNTGCSAFFAAATGVDLSGGVAAAFVQAPTSSGSSASSGAITLASAGSSNNRPISGWAHAVNEVASYNTNWTELDDLGHGSPAKATETQYRGDAFDTSAAASWATASSWAGIAAELKASSDAGGSLLMRRIPRRRQLQRT